MDRFFVDERSGIVAVRDRWYTDPNYNGLHGDTPGVVAVRHGHRDGDGWTVPQELIDEMYALCTFYMAYGPPEDYLPEGNLYICKCGGKIEWDYYPTEHGICENCRKRYNDD